MCVIDRPERTENTIARDEIRTERLTLRAPVTGDVEAITRLCGDYAIASMTSRMPHPYAESDARLFVQLVSRQDRARERTFMIEHEGYGAIGCVGFHKAAGAPLEVGYWIGKPYWGRGFATEAMAGALHWASEDWNRRTIASGHFAGNNASANVLIKSGFLYTGQVQPRHCHASGRVEPTRMMVWIA
jgi:RimJ/RimL family protein N-acetyltransferase